MFGGNRIVMFDLGPAFTTAGSGKEKEKQIPRENFETKSEQMQGVAHLERVLK